MKKIILTLLLLLSFGSLFPGFAQSDTYLKNRIFVEGLYIRNIGSFGDVWANASGGYIGYGIAFPDHNYLMMRTGIINNKLKDELSTEDSLAYDDAYLTMVPIEIGGRYYFIDHMFMPFVQFMTGLNFVFENEDLVGENEDKNLVKFAWQVGFGFTVNVISNLSIDLGVNYQSNFYDDDAMNTGFEYTIGLGWALGN
jgi:opacity protein-like surface antigen